LTDAVTLLVEPPLACLFTTPAWISRVYGADNHLLQPELEGVVWSPGHDIETARALLASRMILTRGPPLHPPWGPSIAPPVGYDEHLLGYDVADDIFVMTNGGRCERRFIEVYGWAAALAAAAGQLTAP
jgi:hypothetical protein